MKKVTLLAAASLLFSGSSFATVIYTSLGPGLTWGGDYTAEHPTLPFSDGVLFRATNSGNLADVLVPAGDDPNGVLTFGLYTDTAGQPDTLLESWTNVSVPTDPSTATIQTLTSVAHPFLTSGDLYFFTATSGPIPITDPPSFGLFWGESPVVSTGGIWGSTNGSPWTHGTVDAAPPAVQLDAVTSAPEPATWALLACSLLGIAACLRKINSPRASARYGR